jgi:hypothetical protein
MNAKAINVCLGAAVIFGASCLAMSPARAGDLIENVPQKMIEILPLEDAQGAQIAAIPVVIYSSGAQVRVEPVPADKNGDLDQKQLRAIFTTGARLSRAQGISVSLGVMIGNFVRGVGSIDDFESGLLIQAEPGLAGGELSIGIASVWAPGSLLGVPLTVSGSDLKATILRSWGTSSHPNQTYAGIQGDVEFFLVKASVGILHRIAGTEGGKWIFDAGVGFGL